MQDEKDLNMEYLEKQFLKRKEEEKDYDKSKKERDKTSFEDNCITKVKTTMVGSIAAFEDKFSFLWAGEEDNTKTKIKALFMRAREEAFDLGNEQIKKLKAEFKKYDVERKKFTMKFFVEDNKK